MLNDEMLNLYKNNVKIKTKIEKVYYPKRYYKRPDLQRLANRWYGMVYRGTVQVDIYARPLREEVRIVNLPKTPVYIYDEIPMAKSVKLETTVYKLRPMAYRFKCPEQVFNHHLQLALKKFWDDVRQLGGAIEKIV